MCLLNLNRTISFSSWQLYDRNSLAKPSNLDHSKVTRYNFAFFQINAYGDIWGTDAYADSLILYGEVDWSWVSGQGDSYCSWVNAGKPPVCNGHNYKAGLIYQAHAAGVEVYPSIGGWTLSNNFPAMAKNPTARKNFAANCVKLIETYDFDGIDIDWEYPGYAEHDGTPADTQNYSLLLQEIRNALDALGKKTGRVYGLTAALPCGPDLIDNIEIDVVSNILTELNLMTYDLYG
jgi:chitinase